jgi:hypothetical protein
MLFRSSVCVLAIGLVLAGAASPKAATQLKSEDPALAAVQKRLGESWIVEPESLSGGKRLLPKTRSMLGRLKARGGFPFMKMLLSHDGTELARTESRELVARAEATRLHVDFKDGKPSITEAPLLRSGLQKTLEAVSPRHASVGQDPGSALSASVSLITILTVRGTFESATVQKSKNGLVVKVSWKQGSQWWEFEESADWTLCFSPKGTLTSLDKERKHYTHRMRR